MLCNMKKNHLCLGQKNLELKILILNKASKLQCSHECTDKEADVE